ncbi:diguanylate cyclase [Mycolicibacterium sp. S2-37]|uniref:diguanylate cyclase domain-containing protein n=1 Tax=Mycolicibacterium sp. S2-37 TaxID=2810297 RepID=UPI001A952977|nr:diguanylate cyclase [Mycolicibacterium sp. S2-37]MBO0677415.1 diguanylate cyclase [Mycolicibacterium sp. S2-37]
MTRSASPWSAEEQRYLRLLDRSVAPILLTDAATRDDSIVFLNAAAARMLAAPAPAALRDHRLWDLMPPDSAAVLREQVGFLAADGPPSPPVDVVLCRLDGRTVRSHAVCARTTWSAGPVDEITFSAPLGSTGAYRQDWETVMDALHEGVVIAGRDGTYEYVNAAARRILGSTDEDITNLPMWNAKGQRIAQQAHPAEFIRRTGMTLSGGVMGVDRVDGSRVWVVGHGCLLHPDDPEQSSVLFSFTDVSEQYAARERLSHRANHDWLTGLPNRAYALTRATGALERAGENRLAAVFFVDLDQLKSVNDRHGHTTGDQVLRVAAARMRAAIRTTDLLARLGGDEFIVLVFAPADRDVIVSVSDGVHRALADPIVADPVEITISASIGVTVIDASDTRQADEIVRDADAAMYRAKSLGPGNTAFW